MEIIWKSTAVPLFFRLKCHNKCTKEAPSCRISFLPSKSCLNPEPAGTGHTCVVWYFQFFLPVAKIRRTESVPSDINNPVDRPQEAPQFGTLPKAITKKVESLYASALTMWSEEKPELCLTKSLLWHPLDKKWITLSPYTRFSFSLWAFLTESIYIFDSWYFMFGYVWDKYRILILTYLSWEYFKYCYWRLASNRGQCCFHQDHPPVMNQLDSSSNPSSTTSSTPSSPAPFQQSNPPSATPPPNPSPKGHRDSRFNFPGGWYDTLSCVHQVCIETCCLEEHLLAILQ